jgi:hypothetical protein
VGNFAVSFSDPSGNAEAFVAEVIRLQAEVHDLNRQLERIEAEIQAFVNELVIERFAQYA